MKNVTIEKTITLNLSASDWIVYEIDRWEDDEDMTVAQALHNINTKIADIINSEQTKRDAYAKGCLVLHKYDAVGAWSYSTRRTLQKLVKLFYGKKSCKT
jgi:hypothetical protein